LTRIQYQKDIKDVKKIVWMLTFPVYIIYKCIGPNKVSSDNQF